MTKIGCGKSHLVVLLENGNIYVGGNNQKGQLNYNPVVTPRIEGKLEFHAEINEKYNVMDIGWGSNHTVLIVKENGWLEGRKKILTWGYHGWLGIDDVIEDDYQLHEVTIPDLESCDNIEFLICKFNSNAVIDNENNFYYWGDEFDSFRVRIPEKKNLFNKRIVDVSFGLRHVIFL